MEFELKINGDLKQFLLMKEEYLDGTIAILIYILENERVIPLYSINDNAQNKDLMKIIKLWKSCVDIFGVNGSCIIGDGFSFIYNHHKYFFSTNYNQSDITTETIDILTKALERIGAIDIIYNYGHLD